MYNPFKSFKSRAVAMINRFKHEVEGVAAIEFALIAPIMILLFFATVEVSTAVAVNRKVSRVSSTLGDLITQSQKLTSDDVTDIMQAAAFVMKPYNHKLKIVISGIEITGGSAKVVWSKAWTGPSNPGDNDNATPYAVGASYSVPTKINKNGTFLVAAKVSTSHAPLFASTKLDENQNLIFDTTAIAMEEEIFLRPRIGSQTTID